LVNFDIGEVDAPTTGVRRIHETPLVEATESSLKGYGCLVYDPRELATEIVRWLAQGWRPIDANVTEGVFGCYLGAPLRRPAACALAASA
jgi:hypothetical protein